jgi:hypothetical protein
MSGTWRYHKDFPEGKIFDTEDGQQHPKVPHPSLGWVDSPAKLVMTQDDVIAAIVKQELAKQNTFDRPLMEAEHKKKYGHFPRSTMSDAELVRALDQPIPKGLKKKATA